MYEKNSLIKPGFQYRLLKDLHPKKAGDIIQILTAGPSPTIEFSGFLIVCVDCTRMIIQDPKVLDTISSYLVREESFDLEAGWDEHHRIEKENAKNQEEKAKKLSEELRQYVHDASPSKDPKQAYKEFKRKK